MFMWPLTVGLVLIVWCPCQAAEMVKVDCSFKRGQ